MATLGTYSSGYKPWTPFVALPENGDAITWDWLNTMSQFSQRFKKLWKKQSRRACFSWFQL